MIHIIIIFKGCVAMLDKVYRFNQKMYITCVLDSIVCHKVYCDSIGALPHLLLGFIYALLLFHNLLYTEGQATLHSS